MYAFAPERRNAAAPRRGFTLIEIMLVMGILLILCVVSILGFNAMRDRAALRAAANSLIFALEESKGQAIAGVGGMAHGVHFDSDAYTQFDGDHYSANSGGNDAHALDAGMELSTDLDDGDESVVFARKTGFVGKDVRVTISLSDDPESARVILIGSGGDISLSDE
jgi:prepilin-type N-terminal cleavage/methylation domain-containing protein